MKKSVLRILGVVMAAVSVFTLIGVVGGMKEVSSAKEYWEEVKSDALYSFDLLDDGIYELSKNQSAYTEGVETYEEGKEAYEAGEEKIEEGQKTFDENAELLASKHEEYNEGVDKLEQGKITLEEGKKKLEEGKAAYAQGLRDYEAGKKKVADGEATLAAEYQNYVDGKKQLEDYYIAYASCKTMETRLNELKSKYAEAESKGDLITMATIGGELATLQAAYDLAMKDIINDYEEGQALIAKYEQGQRDVEAGKKALASAESQLAKAQADIAAGEEEIRKGQEEIAPGEASLAEAKALLDEKDVALEEAKETLEKGKEDLAAGAESLKDGLKQLKLYEGGEEELAAGLDMVLATDTYYNKAGRALVESIADRLGSGFTYWKTDDQGKTVMMNDTKFVDLDKASEVSDTGRDFVDDTEAAVTKELTGKAIGLILAAVAAALGLAAAVLAFLGKDKLPGILAVAGAGVGIVGILLSVIKGTEHPLSHIAGISGGIPGIVVLAAVSVAAAALGCTIFLLKAAEQDKKAEL